MSACTYTVLCKFMQSLIPV